MVNYKLSILDSSMKQEYEHFINKCSDSMLYHSWQYKELIKELLNAEEHFLMAINSGGQIDAILPLLFKDGKFGKIYNSLPFYGSNGGVLSLVKEAEDFLIKEYNAFLLKSNMGGSTLITNPLTHNSDYSSILFNSQDYRIGQFTNLNYIGNVEESLNNSFHYKTRNVIRKAQKEGVKVSIENEMMDFLYHTHKQNMTAIGGKEKPKKFFDLVPKYFTKDTDYKIYVARIDNNPVAAMLIFYFQNTVEYYTPVIVEEYREKQPLSLLIYQAMCDASSRGFKLWNWGGTWATQGGVYTFKKKWGTFDVNYQYYTYTKNKEIFNSNKEELLKEYDNFYVIAFNQLNA